MSRESCVANIHTFWCTVSRPEMLEWSRLSVWPTVARFYFLSDTVACVTAQPDDVHPFFHLESVVSAQQCLSAVTWAEQCGNVCRVVNPSSNILAKLPLIETRSAAVADWQQVTACVRGEPTAADRARQSGAASSKASKQLKAAKQLHLCCSWSRDHLVEAFERRPKAAPAAAT